MQPFDSAKTEEELDAEAQAVYNRIKAMAPFRWVPTEETPETWTFPQKIKSEREQSDGKKHRSIEPVRRIELGSAVNDRKGDPEKAHDYLTVYDLGRVGGQTVPSSFKTTMLDESDDDELVVRLRSMNVVCQCHVGNMLSDRCCYRS